MDKNLHIGFSQKQWLELLKKKEKNKRIGGGVGYNKPCPFCGSSDVYPWHAGNEFWFQCMDCLAHGPKIVALQYDNDGREEVITKEMADRWIYWQIGWNNRRGEK